MYFSLDFLVEEKTYIQKYFWVALRTTAQVARGANPPLLVRRDDVL
jgi:hypothetical protein